MCLGRSASGSSLCGGGRRARRGEEGDGCAVCIAVRAVRTERKMKFDFREGKGMKKKLTGCLIGCLLVLLFMTTPAFAHIKADGTKCQSEGYNSLLGSENQTETQHRMQCITCYEIMWENHWRDPKDEPTCKKQVRCGLCGVRFGPFGEHKFSTATCVAKATWTVCKLQTGEIDPNNHDLKPSVPPKRPPALKRAGTRTTPAPGAAILPIGNCLRSTTTRYTTMRRRPPALR